VNSIKTDTLGIAGRLARYFQGAAITPLLAFIGLLLGVFALIITPREEEPQIDVTMANVLIPFSGASVKNVEQMVSSPMEQILSQMIGVDHVYSVSQEGLSVITVQFKVGVSKNTALVRLYDTVASHHDLWPQNLGVGTPLIKPKGINDVPILSLTLSSRDPDIGFSGLLQVAQSIQADLKNVSGTKEVTVIGGQQRAIRIDVDPARLNSAGLTMLQLSQIIGNNQSGAFLGDWVHANRQQSLLINNYFKNLQDVASLVVGVHNQQPIYLQEVAKVYEGSLTPNQEVWMGYPTTKGSVEYPAVTVSITKQNGQNAIDIARSLIDRVNQLKNVTIPSQVDVTITRNYGTTANEKAMKLMEKLLLATLSVVVLVWLSIGRRSALIVGSAVILTLMVTLFASWAYGFTLNRVSLFALIFSIGILVDDAIVVVENIHRHLQLDPHQPIAKIIPLAVDEVGNPTILATFTVISALLPMAFVTGLMGPYMAPIPINASMGMLLSLLVAFIVTPWLARLWLKPQNHSDSSRLTKWINRVLGGALTRLFDEASGRKRRYRLMFIIIVLLVVAIFLPVVGLVQLKMLPFDNKSEFQIVLDMPPGTPLENTAGVLRQMGSYLGQVPEVVNYQTYVGTSAPINFNGLVRQYDARHGADQGDIQVNLKDKSERHDKSHVIAARVRPALEAIAQTYGASVKVVEVPPGPPVMSPLVAEIYGPTRVGRSALAQRVRQVFEQTDGMVDVDSTVRSPSTRLDFKIDQAKAALLGVTPQEITRNLSLAWKGEAIAWIHDEATYPIPLWVTIPDSQKGNLSSWLSLEVTGKNGLIPLRELVTPIETEVEQTQYHQDLLPVVYVVGDTAGRIDSPLYGLFAMRSKLLKLSTPNHTPLEENFIHEPNNNLEHYTIKWGGEWKITYETFRDMGIAYGVGLIGIYLLVVGQFKSYRMPLIIMAPIPLTILGVMPGHALLGAQFTATSMIGMIALAGIIVRNSILLVDFVQLKQKTGIPLVQAIIESAVARAQPILLTGLAAMMGALFILDDPIFNGLAISLIFGILVSTILSLIVIPVLYYAADRRRPFIASHLED
jgi:multidrug efflux pump subunit AcrB